MGSFVNNHFFRIWIADGLRLPGAKFVGAGFLSCPEVRRCVFSNLLGSFVDIYFFGNSGAGIVRSPDANLGQAVDGAEILTVASGLDATDDVQSAAMIGQRPECEREQGGRTFARRDGFQAEDFTVEQRRFQFPEAALAPPGQGHGADQRVLDFGLRLELALERGEQGGQMVSGFPISEEGLGAQAVTEAVAGGIGSALGRDRSTRFGTVGTGGGSAFFTGDAGGNCELGFHLAI